MQLSVCPSIFQYWYYQFFFFNDCFFSGANRILFAFCIHFVLPNDIEPAQCHRLGDNLIGGISCSHGKLKTPFSSTPFLPPVTTKGLFQH